MFFKPDSYGRVEGRRLGRESKLAMLAGLGLMPRLRAKLDLEDQEVHLAERVVADDDDDTEPLDMAGLLRKEEKTLLMTLPRASWSRRRRSEGRQQTNMPMPSSIQVKR